MIASLGLPLFIVTMAGQNVPGFAVLSTFGYPPPRATPILIGSGLLSVGGAFFGGHVINLAALTAAIMAGPDSHPDRDKRWIAAVAGGGFYLLLGLGAGLATALVEASPPILITAVAGLALLSALVASITAALDDPQHLIVAVVTFLVVASGIVILGIGSAFWGLLVGAAVMAWTGWRGRGSPAAENPASQAVPRTKGGFVRVRAECPPSRAPAASPPRRPGAAPSAASAGSGRGLK